MPQRSCVACRTTRAKRELLRIVRRPTGEVIWDQTAKAAGRGAYLCPDLACLRAAQRGRRLERVLGVGLTGEVFAQLEAWLTAP